jgi:alkylation response protein AidB-like acyl-CoA dehydrogenase
MLPQLPAAQAVAAPCENVAEWWRRHRAIAREHADPIHQAIVGGFVADRVGWAFASGYQAALRALFPDAPGDKLCALCVTEADGNSPKAIRSTLRMDGGWLLNGAKRWTTLGPDGALFFVAARDEAAIEGKMQRSSGLSSGSPGLEDQAMPETKFVPEVPHAQLNSRI